MSVDSERRTALSSYTPPDDIDPRGVTIADLAAPVLEGWRTVVRTLVITSVLVGIGLALEPTRYEATQRLMAISNQRTPSMGGLGGLAGLAGLAGINIGQSNNSALIAEFLRSEEVLREVGELPIDREGHRTRVVDRLTRSDSGEVKPWKVAVKVQEATRVATDEKTGLITLRVKSRDSALARTVATELVDRAREAYVQTLRSQARQLRLAQTSRVDSAGRQLARAEDALLSFRRANRAVPAYSPSVLQEQRLERDADVAKQVYTQAITDRELAIAKELEETPAMVVADPLPPVIPPMPHYRLGKLAAIELLVFVFTAIMLIVADGSRAASPSRRAKTDRVRRAAASIPLFGRWWRERPTA